MTAAIASEIVRLDAVIRTATTAREVLKAQDLLDGALRRALDIRWSTWTAWPSATNE